MASSHSVVGDEIGDDIATSDWVYVIDPRAAAVGASLTFMVTAAPAFAWNGLPGAADVAIAGGLGVALVALTAFDLATFRLPNALTLSLIVSGLLATMAFPPHRLDTALGAALGYGLLWAVATGYQYFRGHAGLGLGDAKLLAAAGAWLGAGAVPTVLLLASALALSAAACAYICGASLSARTRLAFGPFLALSFWLVLLYGSGLG